MRRAAMMRQPLPEEIEMLHLRLFDVRKALESEYAQGKQTACILICDITRPVPNGLNLPVLVRALLKAGVPASGITVLVATGLHRPNEGEELSELVGDEWVEQTVTCVNHFARNDEDHVHVGTTSRGTTSRGATASMSPTSTSSGPDSCGPQPKRYSA